MFLLSGIGLCEYFVEFNIICYVEFNVVGVDMVDNFKNVIVVLLFIFVEIFLLFVVGIDKEFIIEGGSGLNFFW